MIIRYMITINPLINKIEKIIFDREDINTLYLGDECFSKNELTHEFHNSWEDAHKKLKQYSIQKIKDINELLQYAETIDLLINNLENPDDVKKERTN